MVDELKPCPFCGELPQMSGKKVMHACRVLDKEIRTSVSAWNRRAERTYHPERVSTAYHSAIVCSSCKRRLDEVTLYCPFCGSRLEGIGHD